MNKQEQKNEVIGGVDQTNTHNEELGDVLRQVADGEKEKIVEGLVSCLYTEFNESLVLFEDSKDSFEKNGIDFEDLKGDVFSDLKDVLRSSIEMMRKGGVKIDYGSCVVDIIGNTNTQVFGFLRHLKKRGELDEEKSNGIWNFSRKRIKELKSYLEILNSNEEILGAELTKKYGYLDEYTYFFKEKETENRGDDIYLMPTGLSRIKYISFFSKLGSGEFKSREKFEDGLDELTESFLDKNKIKESVKFAE